MVRSEFSQDQDSFDRGHVVGRTDGHVIHVIIIAGLDVTLWPSNKGSHQTKNLKTNDDSRLLSLN